MKKSTLLPCPFCGGPAEVSTGRPNGSGRTKTAVLITEDSFDQDWQDADNNENESFKASIKRALGLID